MYGKLRNLLKQHINEKISTNVMLNIKVLHRDTSYFLIKDNI